MGGKADWLANGMPREGEDASVPYAGDLVDRDPPTCLLNDTVGEVRLALEGARQGFSLVVTERRIVLGRVRRSAIADAGADVPVEAEMEPGPSTVRYDTAARELVERLAGKNLKTAIVTTPSGCLVGVFHRADAERRLGSKE